MVPIQKTFASSDLLILIKLPLLHADKNAVITVESAFVLLIYKLVADPGDTLSNLNSVEGGLDAVLESKIHSDDQPP